MKYKSRREKVKEFIQSYLQELEQKYLDGEIDCCFIFEKEVSDISLNVNCSKKLVYEIFDLFKEKGDISIESGELMLSEKRIKELSHLKELKGGKK